MKNELALPGFAWCQSFTQTNFYSHFKVSANIIFLRKSESLRSIPQYKV